MTKHTKDTIIAGSVIVGLLLLAYLWPVYQVWAAQMSGKAALAHATYSKQVMVQNSKAGYEAAQWDAMRDTVRAHGTARTNQIIGGSITQQYLQWMWVNNLENQEKSVIYVPSQNGIPIMPVQEATRLQPPPIVNKEP